MSDQTDLDTIIAETTERATDPTYDRAGDPDRMHAALVLTIKARDISIGATLVGQELAKTA